MRRQKAGAGPATVAEARATFAPAGPRPPGAGRCAGERGVGGRGAGARAGPEQPFPAAVDDVRAVWGWLRADQRLSASSMAVAGDSAGGGLAEADPTTPLASSLFGLPPLLVQVGTADLLLSDAERLTERAAAAGVDVRLEVAEGLPHVYQLALGTSEAAEATGRIGKFLRERVA